MLKPSPLSRVFFGASLTIAVALIILVASSRPSISKQDTHSLLVKPDAQNLDLPASSQSVVPEADGQPVDSPVESAALPVVHEPTAPDNNASLTAEGRAVISTDRAEPEHVVLPEGLEENAIPLEPNEHAAQSVDSFVAPEALAVSPVQQKPEKNQAEKKQAEKKQPEEKQAPQSSQEPADTDDRIDPLKRLSREFARRAAAKGGSPTKAIPVAPPANEIFAPTVTMSEEHRKSCLVFVGDAMPAASLTDSADEEHAIQQSLGKQLTAIVLWNADNPYALDQFEELQIDLVPFTTLGVQTIAIHVGPVPANYAELCQQFGQGVLCLADPDKSYFQQLATGRLPRTYLLDAAGKIIWLDIEYSRTTRYELRNALHFSLKDE